MSIINVPLQGGSFQCTNARCPLRYHFEVFPTLEHARNAYLARESWTSKFYFQTKDRETGSPSNEWCVAWLNEPVQPFVPATISELIEPDAIRLMEVGLARDFGGPLSVIERTGARIEQLDETTPLMCSEYCRMVRTRREPGGDGDLACVEFDRNIVEKLIRNESPAETIAKHEFRHEDHRFVTYAYFCWAGMVDYACAIHIYGKLIAVVFAGQRRFYGKVPDGSTGMQHLQEGIEHVKSMLRLDGSLLQEAAESNLQVRLEDISERDLPNMSRIAQRLFDLAFERYRGRRDVTEHYFREESTHYIQVEQNTRYGVKCLDRTLARLKEFLGIRQAYFLLNDIYSIDTYEIVARATPGMLTSQEEEFRAILDIEELAIRDRISLFELTNRSKYNAVVDAIVQQLGPGSLRTLWVATCPLAGATNGFWFFIDPQIGQGVRMSASFGLLDKHFLSRFCAKARDTLKGAFATSLVMRNVNHELGSALDKLFKRESEIANGTVVGAKAQEYAQRNLCQLQRYSQILENTHSLFIRRTRGVYRFQVQDLGTIVQDVTKAFVGDPDLEIRNIELRKPVLKGNAFIEVDRDMMKVALFNLLHNAVKYSFRNRYILIQGRELRRSRGDSEYELQIANFGVGILPEEIENRLIFLEDYRGLLSRDMSRVGSGLGLAIAERVVRNHGGRIVARSIPSGELERRKSEYSGTINDPSLVVTEDGNLRFGFLNVFTVFLPYRQK